MRGRNQEERREQRRRKHTLHGSWFTTKKRKLSIPLSQRGRGEERSFRERYVPWTSHIGALRRYLLRLRRSCLQSIDQRQGNQLEDEDEDEEEEEEDQSAMEKISVAVRIRPHSSASESTKSNYWKVVDNTISLCSPLGTPVSGQNFAFGEFISNDNRKILFSFGYYKY